MAISPKMLAVLQKVEAASQEHLAKIRERGKREAAQKARAKLLQTLKRRPPVKEPALRTSGKQKG